MVVTTTYLDHAATTPVRPDAFDAMLPWLRERYGNPSGSHSFARAARKAIDEARDVVAECLGRMPREIVFTSGGTEADNLAVTGVVGQRRGTVVCSAVEHHAVLDAVEALGGRTVGVDHGGRLDLDELVAVLDDEVCLVSVMLANNEVGTIQPVAEVVRLVAEHAPGAVVHSDVVQAISWLDVADLAAGVDLLALSAHKFGGPQGVGALAVREGITLTPLLRGGGQERERRSGTQNVAGIVGMAAALRTTVRERTSTVARIARLRDRLADGLTSTVAGCTESGDRSNKVAGSCSLLLADVETEALLVLMDQAGICATAGSSCASGAMAASHVLRAMGVSTELAIGSLRLSLGWTTSEADVDRALEVIPALVARLRDRSPLAVRP